MKPSSKVAYDYKKLIKMQSKWFGFFTIQRGLTIAAPYIFFVIVDMGVAATFVLLWSFMA